MKYFVKKDTTLLDLILEKNVGMSKQKAKKMIQYSRVEINGEVVKAIHSTLLKEGQTVEFLKLEKPKPAVQRPDRNRPVVILHEDAHIVVAVKPPGLVTAGETPGRETTFHKLLEDFLTYRAETKIRLWAVHRIDREVEGLILFAKSEEIRELFKDEWESVTKKYLALTENRPPEDKGVIATWLKEGPNMKMYCHKYEAADSKYAETEYEYLRPVTQYHLLDIKLHTGRKNQIRAHLAHIGCPIVGDRKYGAKADFVRQVRLLAYHLEFSHPVTGKPMSFEYPPRNSFFNPAQHEDESYKVV